VFRTKINAESSAIAKEKAERFIRANTCVSKIEPKVDFPDFFNEFFGWKQ
jgi:hypothetical protein